MKKYVLYNSKKCEYISNTSNGWYTIKEGSTVRKVRKKEIKDYESDVESEIVDKMNSLSIKEDSKESELVDKMNSMSIKDSKDSKNIMNTNKSAIIKQILDDYVKDGTFIVIDKVYYTPEALEEHTKNGYFIFNNGSYEKTKKFSELHKGLY